MANGHAVLSPSARHRWGACPGSIREEAKFPEPPDGKAAIDGTRTHAMLEELIKNKPEGGLPLRYPESFIGTERHDEYGTFTVTKDRVDRINFAIDYIRGIPGAENAISEQRVFPDGLVGRADMSGTVDVQIPGKDVYHVIDYKDGMAPVEAENNPQLEMYAIGVLAGLEKKPKSIQLTVIQPKLAEKGMNPVSTWNISTKGLLERVPTIVAQATACDAPDAPLIPGDSQCKYCRAKGACPALVSKAMNEVGVMFGPLPTKQDLAMPIEHQMADVAHQAANKDPGLMPVEELVQIYQGASLMRGLLDAVEVELQRRLEAGEFIPGVKLVRGNGRRQWSLPEEEMVKKLTGMGIPKSAIYVTKLVSPTQAEKLVWEKKGEMVKLSDRQLDNMNREYVAQQPGKPTVAHEADPRPAINLNAAPMFGAIDVKAEDVTMDLTGTTTVMTIHGDGTQTVAPPVPDWLAVPAWLR